MGTKQGAAAVIVTLDRFRVQGDWATTIRVATTDPTRSGRNGQPEVFAGREGSGDLKPTPWAWGLLICGAEKARGIFSSSRFGGTLLSHLGFDILLGFFFDRQRFGVASGRNG